MERVTGVVVTPEYRQYKADPELKRYVDARHDAMCGCEDWVYCCGLRPELFDEAVHDFGRG